MTMTMTMMTKEMKKMTTTMKILYIVRDREFQREQIVAMINMTLKREDGTGCDDNDDYCNEEDECGRSDVDCIDDRNFDEDDYNG